MRKVLAVLVALSITLMSTFAVAQSNSAPAGDPPAAPSGQAPDGQSPGGQPPEGQPPEGQAPGGEMPGGQGPGGQSGQPSSYDALGTYTTDTTLSGDTFESTGTDENAILVTDGTLTLDDMTILRTSADSTGGDTSSFYGVGAAVLVTGGTAKITDSTITTSAAGGAGVFAYGDGVAYVSNTTITTAMDTSGGIHVAGGGTLYAKDLTVVTSGASAAAIRSDRGSGIMVVDGGTYTAHGVGSPALYCTADITVNDATLTATGSEALCLEGLNTVRLFDTSLTGNMADLEQNDNTWTVILYQSMSGDSEIGKGVFEMVGGSLTSENGGLFYTTNTESEFILSNVAITTTADSEYLLRCTGNSNQRGWGTSGANGADTKFTAIDQQLDGNVIWDSISTLEMYLTQGSVLNGAVMDDETHAGNGGTGYCTVNIDAASTWVVTANSVLTTLNNAGSIVDADGNTVSVMGTDGTTFVQGTSAYTVTVAQYSDTCDTSNAGVVSAWSDYAVQM